MKTITTIFLALFIQASAFSQTAISYKELNAREGLPNFFAKLHHGDSVKIAYFGGSITDAGSGWRDQTMDWLKTKYPKNKIEQVNAAIPGTGSDFGVFRLDKDVLIHKPDLVFVEYAVNDRDGDTLEITKSIEGIVRKIRKTLPYCEICFVYTICIDMDSTLNNGTLPVATSIMEKVADYYRISSIFMATEVVKFLKEGKLVWKGKIEENPGKFVFTPDGYHPFSQTGHKLYAEAVERSFQKMEAVSKLKKYSLIKPLNKDNYEMATMIPINEIIKNDPNWEYLKKGNSIFDKFSQRLSVIAKSKNDQASFTVKFIGSKFGLLDVGGPTGCNINISVNDSKSVLYQRFSMWSMWVMIGYFFVDEIKKEGEHTVTIKVSGEKINKKEILLENDMNKDLKMTDEYKEYHYYPGYIMLIGNVVN